MAGVGSSSLPRRTKFKQKAHFLVGFLHLSKKPIFGSISTYSNELCYILLFFTLFVTILWPRPSEGHNQNPLCDPLFFDENSLILLPEKSIYCLRTREMILRNVFLLNDKDIAFIRHCAPSLGILKLNVETKIEK